MASGPPRTLNEGREGVANPPARRQKSARRLSRIEGPAPVERAEPVNVNAPAGRPARVERLERPRKPERVDKPERLEPLDKPERVERVERPPRPERIQRVERPERIEKPQRRGP